MSLIAGSVFLLPVKNVSADANLSGVSSTFISADAVNRVGFMDSGGVWNGATEVTNSTGDTLRLLVTNSASGANPTEIQNNTAYDLAVTATPAADFRLPTSPFAVTVTELSGGGNCLAIAGVNATQPGGVGTAINFNVPANTDIPPGCQYQFDLGITTTSVAPFVGSGNYDIDFDVAYTNFDNTPAAPSETDTLTIEVRGGDVAIVKTNVSAGPVADGATADFDVSVIASGQGGIFNVVVTDTLGPDFNPASLSMSSVSGGTFVSPNFTIPYIYPNGSAVVIDVSADVQVDPAALSCPVLSNQVDVVERTQHTDTSTDSAAFDLQEPLLAFSAPDIDVPLNGGPTTVSVAITNNGTGTAKNIVLTVPGAGTDLDNFGINVISANWAFNSATDVFTYTGTLLAGATETLQFQLTAAVCPPPAGGNLDWTLTYQNVCGTTFNPAQQSSTLAVTNVPDATITKTASVGALNVGQAASYNLALGGTNLTGLPVNDADNTNNNDFSVTDTFPLGISNISIPAIPAGTAVEVQGVGTFTGSVPVGQIPNNGTIIWRGDAIDLLATPSMQVDFEGGAPGVCPTGQNIANTADLVTNCGITDNDTGGFILNENPAGGATLNISVGGGPFEAGAPDTDDVNRNENREGEHIPFNVAYSFPVGYEAGAISWTNLQFNAELRTAAPGAPLVLTNNRNSVLLTVTAGGAPTACTQTALTPTTHFTGGEGINPLVITDFGFVPVLCGIAAIVDDVTLQLEYAATSPLGNLSGADPYNDDPVDEANLGAYVENTALTIVGATPGCTGTAVFNQGVNVTIDRADLELTGSINNGNPISVCSVVPVNVNVDNLVADTSADDALFQLGLTNLQIVDGVSAASADVNADITRTGGFSTMTLISPAANNTGPVNYEQQPTTVDITTPGAFSFNARVLDVGTAFNATLSYDSKHTSPDAGGDADRDLQFLLNVAPTNFLVPDLDLEFFPPSIILRDQTSYTFRAHITNTGDGDAVGGVFQVTLPPEMNFVSSNSAPAGVLPSVAGQVISWDLSQSALGPLGTGEAIDIDINVSITQNSCFQTGTPALDEINSLTDWGCGASNQELLPDTPPIILPTAQVTLRHDLNNSYCELCNEGEVHLFVRNTGGILATNNVIIEDFLATGLEFVPGSMSCVSDEGACNVAVQPTQAGTQLTINSTNIPMLANLYSAFSTAANTPQQIEIIYRMRRPIGNEEGLTSVVRDIRATGTYGLFCDQNAASPASFNAIQDDFTLPIRQPVPQVIKQGRNVDAAQTSSQYTDTVYGGRGDRVIWRINVRNLGDADLEDLLLNDTITPTLAGAPNLNFLAVCPTELADPTALTRPFAMPAGCVAPDNLQSTVEDVATPFGAGGVNGEDINAGSNEYVYILGEILAQCTNMDNVADVSWGCDGEDGAAPYNLAGGLVLPASPIPSGFDIDDGDPENLSTAVNPAGVTVITHTARGVDGGAEMGYRGRISFTIRNASGGTVKNLIIRDTLPTGYAIDPTQFTLDTGNYYLPLSVATNFGNNYVGMVERVQWLNRSATFENNVAPEFQLVSDPNVAPIEEAPDRINIIRHGDEITITYDIVRIADFDVQAVPDIAQESSATCSDPRFPGGFSPIEVLNPGTDCPAPVAAGFTNQSDLLEIGFDNSCDITLRDIDTGTGTPANSTTLNNIQIDPEDLDLDIDPGTNRVYILSDPTAFLDLPVIVQNNGDHNATNHYVLVTVGGGLSLPIGPPAGCTALAGAPAGRVPPTLAPLEVWPPDLPATSTVFRCGSGLTIGPGAGNSLTYTFRVQKQGTGNDLTFRADVIGEIILADNSTVLDFPPVVSPAFMNFNSNYYTLDSVRARIIGFNLTNTLPANCSEDAAAVVPPENVEIGEDCRYHLAANWFGFETPGFGNITVENIIVTDDFDAGLGFVALQPPVGMTIASSTLPAQFAASSTATLNLDPILDHLADPTSFDVDIDGRALNDPVNVFGSTLPNFHNQARVNEANASFRVYFDRGGPTETFIDFNNASPGYPPATLREVNTNITEPNLVVTKEVCNQTLTPACNDADYSTALVGGDADDVYIVRVQIFNDDNSGTDFRATAYDVAVSHFMDPDAADDLLIIQPVAADGLDNDGDGVVDEVGEDTEIQLINNDTSGTQGQMNVIPTLDIPSGTTASLFYRIDISDSAVPGQSFDLSTDIAYDSLDGASGSQNPASVSGTISGARQYTGTAAASITVSSIIIASPSKGFIDKSNITDVPFPGTVPPAQTSADVTIGEEIEVQISVEIPVSTLRNFTISDELPAGMTCVEASPMVFSTVPDANGLAFTTAGSYAATGCPGSGTVSWQATAEHILVDTTLPPTGDTYTMSVSFIARVDNSVGNVAGTAIINGDDNGATVGVGAGTNVTVSYDDEQLPPNTTTLEIPSATMTIREPNVQLTIATGTANVTPPPLVNTITEADAGDVYTVSVLMENTSVTPANLSPAYNLQIVADLTAIPGASYVAGSLAGPNAANFTEGASLPGQLVLNYNNPSLAPLASQSITFNVLVPADVQPHDVLQTSVTANYTSLLSNTVALNGGGVIGANNAADGMRVYAQTEVDNTVSVPALTSTKIEDPLSDAVPTIGARKRFQVQINFPEGLTRSGVGNLLTIADNLAAAGSTTSYVLENNASFPIQYDFVGIQSINGVTDSAQFVNQITAPADGAINAINWTFAGDVLTTNENDLDAIADVINPYIRVTYYARIDDNLATTNAGDIVVNSAQATYFDRSNGPQATAPQSVGPFTVLEPDLRMDKSAAATINVGTPETYTLDIRNDGGSTAWNATITDVMIEPALGGMCDTPPANIQAEIQDGIGNTVRSLVLNTDYTAVFVGDPTCTLTLTMVTAAAGIESGNHLIVNYDATLDLDNVSGSALDNIAGVTEYFSLQQVNTAARTYTNTLSPDYATAVAAVPFEDFEDAHRITIGAPRMLITQSVIDPASPIGVVAPALIGPTAEPGDTVLYQIHIVNQGSLGVSGFNLTEDLDLLNPGVGYFAANTLNVVFTNGGIDASNPTGGTRGTGSIDIQNLNIGPANPGNNTDEVLIQFEIDLLPVITNATQVLNQGQTVITGFSPILSDDPDPALTGATDPTVLTIDSKPTFLVQKSVADITGDPNVLVPGDFLRYTLTVKNIGKENASNVTLQDLTPANTTYVANSVTLNGVQVSLADNGVSPLQDGMLINAPENTTPGFMAAVDISATNNIATVTFDVQTDTELINGAVITNQGFVTGQGLGSGVFGTSPSDDPATPAIFGDPTRIVVGNLPILEVRKSAAIEPTGVTNGDDIIDPGETVRYTIVVENRGDTNATNVRLIDPLPNDVTYITDSIRVNGAALPGSDGGILPLIAGIDISSSDLPSPAPNQGTITTGQAATITFDVTVNGAPGIRVINQATVTSVELSDELSDADGDSTNGNQPTIFVIGNVQQLIISKNVFVVDGGLAEPGKILEYVVQVDNVGNIPASDIVVTDAIPAGLNYIANSGQINGATAGVTFTPAPDTITANYEATYDDLDAGESFSLRFRAQIDAAATLGTTILNTANITWNGGVFNDSASVQIDVGGAPGVGTLSGRVWNDADRNDLFDTAQGDIEMPNWTVEVYLRGILLDTAATDEMGLYRFLGVPVSEAANDYDLVYIVEGGNALSTRLGETSATEGTTGLHRIDDFNVGVGEAIVDQNLPIEPNGVVYDSLLRTPIEGATLRLLNAAGQAVPASCFPVDSNQQNQLTSALGYYRFDLNFSDPVQCPNNANYTIEVIPPATGYITGVSSLLPPANDVAIYDVPACAGDLNPVTPQCEIQAAIIAPDNNSGPNTPETRYYLALTLANVPPVDNQAYNNHIPLDPDSFPADGVSITKTSALLNVNRGQLVPYIIRVTNNLNLNLFDMEVRDQIPPGFKYVQQSTRVEDPTSVPTETRGGVAEPVLNGLQLTWQQLDLAPGETVEIKMLLIVGSGVGEGEYINRATAFNGALDLQASETATATVRVVPDPTFDCSDVIGKVFDDKNLSGYQEEGEKGIPNARVYTAKGLQVTTDEFGRFHITCAVVPNPDRGSNFIIKLDDRSLPSGYRITTENPRVQRATRGKMLKYNFGAAIHRVVRLDMADAVFEPGKTEVRLQWQSRLDMLITELARDPSVLRLSYLAEVEDPDLVDDRIDAVKKIITERWEGLNCCYKLMIETEVFWRTGGPPDRGELE